MCIIALNEPLNTVSHNTKVLFLNIAVVTWGTVLEQGLFSCSQLKPMSFLQQQNDPSSLHLWLYIFASFCLLFFDFLINYHFWRMIILEHFCFVLLLTKSKIIIVPNRKMTCLFLMRYVYIHIWSSPGCFTNE